jgi:hypothetical protein
MENYLFWVESNNESSSLFHYKFSENILKDNGVMTNTIMIVNLSVSAPSNSIGGVKV